MYEAGGRRHTHTRTRMHTYRTRVYLHYSFELQLAMAATQACMHHALSEHTRGANGVIT